MATRKITDLPLVVAAQDTDQFEVVQDGVSRRVTRAQIRSGLITTTAAQSGTAIALSMISDAGALAGLDTVDTAQMDEDSVDDTILSHTGITEGEYTFGTGSITFNAQGRATSATSGGAGGGGLTTAIDSGTALTVGAANGTHKVLDAATTITLTLSNTAAVGVKQAFTPAGAGAVAVATSGGSGYWLRDDDTTGTARTAGFGLTGYGYFEVFRNTGGSAAEWLFIGESDIADTADNDVDFADKVLSRPELKDVAETFVDAGNKSGAASFDYSAGGWQKCVATGNITSMAVTNPPASGKGGAPLLEIHQDGTGNRTIAWGAAFRFVGGTDATLSTAASAIDFFTLVTRDAGSTWYVFEGGKAFAA